MKKSSFVLSLTIILIFIFVNKLFSQTSNLLLHENYAFNPIANYKHTNNDNLFTLLTDGRYTMGYFWLDQTTVGWQNRPKIEIDLNFKKQKALSSIKFSTALNKGAGVYLPKSIMVFGKLSDTEYFYLGDITENVHIESTRYRKITLNLDFVKSYILSGLKIVVVPQGMYAFVDELEAFNNNKVPSIVDKSKIIKEKDFNLYVSNRISTITKASGQISSKLRISDSIKERIVFNWSNPWHNDLSKYIIEENSNVKKIKYLLLSQQEYLSFNITNNSAKAITTKIELSNNSNRNLALYYCTPIQSLTNSCIVIDPLLDDRINYVFQPYETKSFLLKIIGNEVGSQSSSIKIISNNKIVEKPFTFITKRISKEYDLNSNVWSYLNNTLIIGRKKEAVEDLSNHGVNTFVIPPEIFGCFDQRKIPSFENYIKNIKANQPKNIILFCNFKNKLFLEYFRASNYDKEKIANNFNSWYSEVVNILKNKHGFSSRILLYPYDEINEVDDLEFYVKFVSAVKKLNSNVLFYSTIGNSHKLSDLSLSKLIDITDVFQVADNERNMTLSKLILDKGKECWLYDAKPSAELLSPYSYYRLISWKAYLHNLTGVGFWAYSDYKGNPYDSIISNNGFNSSVNFSVIYIDRNRIIGSRRWEAYLRGKYDYEILRASAEKFGRKYVEELVKEVVLNISDDSLADKVIGDLVEKL